jgi:hypothetical protein
VPSDQPETGAVAEGNLGCNSPQRECGRMSCLPSARDLILTAITYDALAERLTAAPKGDSDFDPERKDLDALRLRRPAGSRAISVVDRASGIWPYLCAWRVEQS